MAATLEELEARLTALEREVALLRSRAAAPAPSGARPPLPGQADQAVISAATERALAAMGITEQPIGAEKVQEMIAACGFRPEDNEFSRGIIEMREE